MHSLTNMYVIDNNGYPRKYASAELLLSDFCYFRLPYYEKRQNYWLGEWRKQVQKENNRYKFVKLVVDKKLNMHQDDEKLEANMLQLGLEQLSDTPSFDYLLSMQMRSMTKKRLEEIKKEIDVLQAKIEDWESKTPSDLWKLDLEKFKTEYPKFVKGRTSDI